MRLVLIDDNLVVVKEYENNCTQEDIDGMFAKMERLIIDSKHRKPPPLPVLPVTTLSGPSLTAFIQGQLEYFMVELKAREEVKNKADNYLKTKAGIFRNNVWTAVLNWFNKKFKAKKKEESKDVITK